MNAACVLTSAASPIRVAWLADTPGRVGLTLAPGKQAWSKSGDRWARDLDADLHRLKSFHEASVLVCLLQHAEMKRLGIGNLVERAEVLGFVVYRLPIRDGGVLPALDPVDALIRAIDTHVCVGKNVVVHCAGGLGRAGTIGGCWLVRRGMSAEEAIDTLHRRRSWRSPETKEQEQFIARYERMVRRRGRR